MIVTFCSGQIFSDPHGWRYLQTPCVSLPTRSPSHRAQPRGKPGFSTRESTDSPLEQEGFEPVIPPHEGAAAVRR